MVRFGEARSRRDLVWYGEAGEARRGQVRFGLSGSGQARHDVVGQVWQGAIRQGVIRSGTVR